MTEISKTATLEDVAKLAGVSLGSASRALSVPDQVKPKTLAKVNQAVAQLGYVRNGAARALASRKTRTIAAIYPTLTNPIFAISIDAMQRTLSSMDYQLLVASHEYDSAREVDLVRNILEHSIDGLVLVGSDHDDEVFRLIRHRRIPYVLTWSTDETTYPHTVGFSNHQASYEMAKLVLSKGHTKIAICGGATAHNERARARLKGAQSAITEAGIEVPPHWILEAPFTYQGGRDVIRSLWEHDERPTALVCGTDMQAIGALHECASRGIAVPEELSITGFDDTDLASMVTPALTTVHIPVSEIGVLAAEKIVALISNETLPEEERLATYVIERASLGSAKVGRRKQR